jgi:hypothetical protein
MGVHGYKSPTLPDVGMSGGVCGVYEKSGVGGGDGGGNGLERYTREGKAVRMRGGGEIGREVGSQISPATSGVHSLIVSELQSPTFRSPVAELHSPTIEKRVAELHSPIFGGPTAGLATEGGKRDGVGREVAEIGGSEIRRGAELDATSGVQSRFYAGGK